MPGTAIAIDRQLRVGSLVIPDYWTVDAIKPGYEIGTVEYLFGSIKPQKAAEWRTVFGAATQMRRRKHLQTKNARERADRGKKK